MKKVIILTAAVLALTAMTGAEGGCGPTQPAKPSPTTTLPIIDQPAPKSGDPDYVP